MTVLIRNPCFSHSQRINVEHKKKNNADKIPGAGKSPGEWSTVEVNQRILVVDGTVIKNTSHGTETDTFTMAEVIDGLKEGLPLREKGHPLAQPPADRLIFCE